MFIPVVLGIAAKDAAIYAGLFIAGFTAGAVVEYYRTSTESAIEKTNNLHIER